MFHSAQKGKVLSFPFILPVNTVCTIYALLVGAYVRKNFYVRILNPLLQKPF